MNKKKLLLTLAIGTVLGGCGCGDNSNQPEPIKEQPKTKSITDTMLVIGVWNRPETRISFAKKGLVCVDKNGFRHEYYKELTKRNDVELLCTQRGDTVCINGCEIVENLTMKHMAERYVNGR